MNQAEIIAMATEAGFEWDSLGLRDRFCFERFAALVAAKEREACALVCDGFDTGRRLTSDFKAAEMAVAIRARGQKEGA